MAHKASSNGGFKKVKPVELNMVSCMACGQKTLEERMHPRLVVHAYGKGYAGGLCPKCASDWFRRGAKQWELEQKIIKRINKYRSADAWGGGF